MAKHILFLIHGIGVHGTEWGEELAGPIDTLKRLSAQYAFFGRHALEDRVEFVPLAYDHIFNEIIAQWRGDANAVMQFDPTGVLRDSLDWLGTAGTKEQDFWWSHIADLAMYRFFPVYRQRVRSFVIARMAERIERAKAEDGEATCSVLGHSMGTAVAHDCLHLLGTERWGERANPLNPAHWRFNHVFMVANTSRLLQSDIKAYESIVRPGALEDPGSYCATYWNFRHEADVVPFPRMFEPVGWKNYASMLVRHFRGANVHDLSHYLLNPRVHIPILRKLISPRAVTPEEEVSAVDSARFPQFGGNLAFVEKARQLAARLEALKAGLGDDPQPKAWLASLVAYFKLMDEAR